MACLSRALDASSCLLNTTFIIAHRFSTIRIADRILVFDEGRIVGDGTFAELEASHPLFQLLLRQQQTAVR